MPRIILVAETGSDIPPEIAKAYGICMVPMHVTFGVRFLRKNRKGPEDQRLRSGGLYKGV